jgi:UTP-glucose-1-phosphate uridylyltransferase
MNIAMIRLNQQRQQVNQSATSTYEILAARVSQKHQRPEVSIINASSRQERHNISLWRSDKYAAFGRIHCRTNITEDLRRYNTWCDNEVQTTEAICHLHRSHPQIPHLISHPNGDGLPLLSISLWLDVVLVLVV